MDQTAQFGSTGVLGSLQFGGAGISSPAPPLDPSTVPWNVAINSGDPPQWRRRTLESFVAYTVLPQPPVDPSTIASPQTVSDFHQRLTPRWRYNTQDSFITPVYPAFNPAQQLNLINQGLNHRKLGAPTLTGGQQGLLVFVSGVNETGTFAALTAKMTRQLGTTGTCTAVFNVPSGGFTPALGGSIVIIENNKTLFSGIITDRKLTVYPATTMSRWELTGTDWNGLLQRHLCALDLNADSLFNDASAILGNSSVFGDHISLDAVDKTISVGDPFSFAYVKCSDALNELALSTNTVWWVDNNKILHFILIANAIASSYSIAENAQQVDPDTIQVEDALDNYRNTQYVRTSQQLLPVNITLTESHTFTGAPGDIVCQTTYPLTSAPSSVKENGVELVGTARFFQLHTDGTPTTYPPTDGYYWAVGFFGIWHWPSSTPPINGTTLAVQYTGVSTYQGNVVVYKDSAQITAMQAVSGGSGIFEEIVDYSGTLTYAAALALAQGTEQATAPAPKIITATTVEQVEDIGYAVSVNLPRWGINGTYIIQQIDRTDAQSGADLGKGTRFRTTLQLVSARTLGNFTQYFERLQARLMKNSVAAPTEKPSWSLAFDSPGNISAGLKTGSFGAPWSVQTSLGRILYVSAVFATAADANITIDILLNGVSIFDSTKLVYTPAQTGITELYGNLNPQTINVKQGDQLTLSVLTTGSVAPGKNGTVIVVIGQR